MGYKVDNAVIMAAGTASRFAPLSYEKPKALITVKGEVLIERQIKQLIDAGIKEIILVTGYKKEMFEYLKDKFNVKIVNNEDYLIRNNNSSIYAAREFLHNTYVCSSDNYFVENPFEREVDDAYYAAVYADGETKEWCFKEDSEGYISDVTVGGKNSWYMMGHTFWNENFSKKFTEIIEDIYSEPETEKLFWEDIFIKYINEFKMKIRKYPYDLIFEFDTLDELRKFDKTYIDNTESTILKNIADKLKCSESEIINIKGFNEENNSASGFSFQCKEHQYEYRYNNEKLIEI